MAFRKIERQASLGAGIKTTVRIAHNTPAGPLITIPRAVANLAGIAAGDRVDIMIDTDQTIAKIAVVSKGDGRKAFAQREGGPICIVAGQLREHIPRMRTTPVSHEIGLVEDRHAIIFAVPARTKTA